MGQGTPCGPQAVVEASCQNWKLCHMWEKCRGGLGGGIRAKTTQSGVFFSRFRIFVMVSIGCLLKPCSPPPPLFWIWRIEKSRFQPWLRRRRSCVKRRSWAIRTVSRIGPALHQVHLNLVGPIPPTYCHLEVKSFRAFRSNHFVAFDAQEPCAQWLPSTQQYVG